jgi:hypothetical protein
MLRRLPHLPRGVDGGGIVLVAMRRLAAAALLFSCFCSTASARADVYVPPSPEDSTFRKVEPERRAGVVLGFAPGVAFAGASGYPNNQKLVNNPDFYNQTPLLVGYSNTIFLMGAFSDYISVGPMVSWATFDTKDWRSVGWGLGFRIEGFPLLRVVPSLADLSVFTQLGVGTTEARHKGGDYPTADGTSSFAGIGLHHEFRAGRMLGGHAALGPFVEYDAIFSTTAERHWLTAGLRLAFYGGTVLADRK